MLPPGDQTLALNNYPSLAIVREIKALSRLYSRILLINFGNFLLEITRPNAIDWDTEPGGVPPVRYILFW